MQALHSMKVKVSLAWWWRFYAFGLLTMVAITGLEPDWQKVEAMIMKAVRIRVE